MNIRYNLTEANQLLKLVRVIANEMLERRTERRTLARKRVQLEQAITPESFRRELAELDARIWEHDEALSNCKHELEGLGLTVLRTNPLTVHIPGRTTHAKAGAPTSSHTVQKLSTEVVFCWQDGEEDLCFGHQLGEEEHQRRPLRVAKRA